MVVPCYNSARYLEETFASILAQTMSDLEIILVDDGSSDGTRGLISKLLAAHPERRIRTHAQENAGQAAARNRGIAMARGAYILPLDSDDLIAPTLLELGCAVLDAEAEMGLVYTDREEFGVRDAYVPSGVFLLDRLKYFNQLPYCALYRKSLWEAVGGYSVNVSGFDDWDFWIAAAALGARATHRPGAYLKHRRRAGSQMTQIVGDYDRLFARIILNNASVYSKSEIEAADVLLTRGVTAPLFRSARFVFMGLFHGEIRASMDQGGAPYAS